MLKKRNLFQNKFKYRNCNCLRGAVLLDKLRVAQLVKTFHEIQVCRK